MRWLCVRVYMKRRDGETLTTGYQIIIMRHHMRGRPERSGSIFIHTNTHTHIHAPLKLDVFVLLSLDSLEACTGGKNGCKRIVGVVVVLLLFLFFACVCVCVYVTVRVEW